MPKDKFYDLQPGDGSHHLCENGEPDCAFQRAGEGGSGPRAFCGRDRRDSRTQRRRHLNKGQQAMAMAFAYPEPDKRGRGNKGKAPFLARQAGAGGAKRPGRGNDSTRRTALNEAAQAEAIRRLSHRNQAI
jgi:hypothetical protein